MGRVDPIVISVNSGQGLTGVTPCGPWLEGMAHTHTPSLWQDALGAWREAVLMKEKEPRMLRVHPLPGVGAGRFPGDLTALLLAHDSHPGGSALLTVRAAASSEQLASADTVLV